MRLHAKLPLVALLGVVHLGIPLLGASLHRTEGTNNGRIHNGGVPSLRLWDRRTRSRLPSPTTARRKPSHREPLP